MPSNIVEVRSNLAEVRQCADVVAAFTDRTITATFDDGLDVDVDVGAVEFPLTLSWSVDAVEVDQPDVEIGSVDFPLTLAWSVDAVETDTAPTGGVSVTVPLTGISDLHRLTYVGRITSPWGLHLTLTVKTRPSLP